MKKHEIDKIFAILSAENPSPKTELEYVNEFTLLVAIILSAQSTDVQVNKVTKEFFKKVTKPEDILDIGLEGVKNYIKTLGLYNSKANNLIKLAEFLSENPMPQSLKDLQKLPGVGSKTARVFLNCAYGEPVIAVDTHVFRTSKRLGLSKGKDAKQVETELNDIVPKKWLLNAHHWLILHGRYVCKARNPSCDVCKLSSYCKSYKDF